jgi:hypothetical protein
MNYVQTRNTESKSTFPWHVLPVSRAYFVSLTFAVLVMWSISASAQPDAGMENEHQHSMQTGKSLAEQIGVLHKQVSELETKVREQGVDTTAMKKNGDELRLKTSMALPGKASQAPGMSPNANAQISPAAQAPQMGMMAGMMSMMNSMMGGMGGGAPMGQGASMGSSSLLSVLPGFPGASHLYHIGSTNFFLDHPEHINLSLEQQSRLSELSTQSLLRGSEFNRKIQEGEEQLWLLTAVDQPNLALIEVKIREIEKLRGDLRVTFIKDVGEAAKTLTDEQRKALLGQSSNLRDAPTG